MKVIDKGTHREIQASEGMYLSKSGFYFKECVMLPGENESDYTEITEEEVQEFLKQNEDGRTETK